MEDDVLIRTRRVAMGCEFEFLLCGPDRDHLLDAAEEAFDEILRLEQQLSVFIPTSELSYLNANASRVPVQLDPRLFDLLLMAKRISAETEGAFDPSSGALIDAWRDSVEVLPDRQRIRELLWRTGMSAVILDESRSTIQFAAPGPKLNLGALGKGYAIRRAAELLMDRGVNSALLSAGSSTVYAMGSIPGGDPWPVGIRNPAKPDERIMVIGLRNRALSTSGNYERFVEANGVRYGHVLDPRTGFPVNAVLSASALTDDPAESDALSTAFFVLGVEGTRRYCDNHRNVGAIMIVPTPEGTGEIIRIGIE